MLRNLILVFILISLSFGEKDKTDFESVKFYYELSQTSLDFNEAKGEVRLSLGGQTRVLTVQEGLYMESENYLPLQNGKELLLIGWRNIMSGRVLRLECFQISSRELIFERIKIGGNDFQDYQDGNIEITPAEKGTGFSVNEGLHHYVNDGPHSARLTSDYVFKEGKMTRTSQIVESGMGKFEIFQRAAHWLHQKDYKKAAKLYAQGLKNFQSNNPFLGAELVDQVKVDYAAALKAGGDEKASKVVLEEIPKNSPFYKKVKELMLNM